MPQWRGLGAASLALELVPLHVSATRCVGPAALCCPGALLLLGQVRRLPGQAAQLLPCSPGSCGLAEGLG